MKMKINLDKLTPQSKELIKHVFTIIVTNQDHGLLYSELTNILKIPKPETLQDIKKSPLVQILVGLGLVEINQYGENDIAFFPAVQSYFEIPAPVKSMFKELCMSDDDMRVMMLEKKFADKTEDSAILHSSRGFPWYEVAVGYPEENQPVVIRIKNPNRIAYEGKDDYTYVEDVKIASWNGKEWKIRPPFPKYDMSPCSDHENVIDGCVVTHWAEATEDEIENWDKRFDYLNQYDHLEIKVDKKHHRDVYMALLYGAAALDKVIHAIDPNSSDRELLLNDYRILCDLQACMDKEDSVIED